MSSLFACKGVCAIKGMGLRDELGWGRGGAKTVQVEAVGLRHGTRADGTGICIHASKTTILSKDTLKDLSLMFCTVHTVLY
jgi:hypothetical protein